jgi:hypothetical protein
MYGSGLLDFSAPPGALRTASPELMAKIPYVTTWESESLELPPLKVYGERVGKDFLGYKRERLGDRDANGTLWLRTRSRPGVGKPQLGKFHPVRQRRAIGGLLCSVCGKPTAPEATEDGYLYVMSKNDFECSRGVPFETVEPPVHIACGWTAAHVCPHLRGGYVALRGKSPKVWGALGQVIIPNGDGTLRNHGVLTISRDDWRMRWIVAQSLLSAFDAYTLVDLKAEVLKIADAAALMKFARAA